MIDVCFVGRSVGTDPPCGLVTSSLLPRRPAVHRRYRLGQPSQRRNGTGCVVPSDMSIGSEVSGLAAGARCTRLGQRGGRVAVVAGQDRGLVGPPLGVPPGPGSTRRSEGEPTTAADGLRQVPQRLIRRALSVDAQVQMGQPMWQPHRNRAECPRPRRSVRLGAGCARSVRLSAAGA